MEEPRLSSREDLASLSGRIAANAATRATRGKVNRAAWVWDRSSTVAPRAQLPEEATLATKAGRARPAKAVPAFAAVAFSTFRVSQHKSPGREAWQLEP